MKRTALLLAIVFMSAAAAMAQTPRPLQPNVNKWTVGVDWLNGPLEGTWWRNEQWIRTLNLTPEQQKKTEDVFQQYRLQLIELSASLTREEAILQPLLADVRPEDEARILEEIDRVAMARAELEKVNARMLLRMRQVLTPEQWNQVSSRGKKQLFFK